MAPTQSKPVALGSAAARARTIRGIISQLTSMYLRNRTRITQAVYITLFVGLISRIRNALADQKPSRKPPRRPPLRRYPKTTKTGGAPRAS